mmetsp:Transcript_85739/g.227847  ORF Transcript_85739/g.227847 Transcript_85739/m.227847 type:complete len:233 (-) Transcript_85739:271-969(-)
MRGPDPMQAETPADKPRRCCLFWAPPGEERAHEHRPGEAQVPDAARELCDHRDHAASWTLTGVIGDCRRVRKLVGAVRLRRRQPHGGAGGCQGQCEALQAAAARPPAAVPGGNDVARQAPREAQRHAAARGELGKVEDAGLDRAPSAAEQRCAGARENRQRGALRGGHLPAQGAQHVVLGSDEAKVALDAQVVQQGLGQYAWPIQHGAGAPLQGGLATPGKERREAAWPVQA